MRVIPSNLMFIFYYIKFSFLINLMFFHPVLASDEFCENQSPQTLEEEFCFNPLDVICNGKTEIYMDHKIKAQELREREKRALLERIIQEARNNELERSDYLESRKYSICLPNEGASVCTLSESDMLGICDSEIPCFVDEPDRYFLAENGKSSFYRFERKVTPVLDDHTKSYFEKLIVDESQDSRNYLGSY